MAIRVKDTIRRSLEEEVEYLKKNVHYILTEEGTLNEFGLVVVDQIDDDEEMPTVEEFKATHEDWQYGNAILRGSESPYIMFILTRANDGHPSDYWLNIGEFPRLGPEGKPGQDGKDGESIVGPEGPRGPQGETGPQGDRGPRGFHGHNGEQGEKGEPASIYKNKIEYTGKPLKINSTFIIDIESDSFGVEDEKPEIDEHFLALIKYTNQNDPSLTEDYIAILKVVDESANTLTGQVVAFTLFPKGGAEGNFVTVDTTQTISGAKSFTDVITILDTNNRASWVGAGWVQIDSSSNKPMAQYYSDRVSLISKEDGAVSQLYLPSKSGTFALTSDIPDVDNFIDNDELQSVLTDYAKTEDIPDISNLVSNDELQSVLTDYAMTSQIPTKTSDLENDSGFITNSEVEGVYATQSDLNAVQQQANNTEGKLDTFLGSDPETLAGLKELIAQAEESGEIAVLENTIGSLATDLSNLESDVAENYATKAFLGDYVAQEIATKADRSELDNYATLSDLDNKQDVLTPGTGITIENNVISATGGDLSNFVTLDGAQTITGAKTFLNRNGVYIRSTASGEFADSYLHLNRLGFAIIDPISEGIQQSTYETQYGSSYIYKTIGNTRYDLYIPNKSGTIALTSDIPTIPDIPDVSGKLDKVTTSDTYARLYGITANGTQNTYQLTSGNIANTIAARNSSGQINVADPTAQAHAVNVRYLEAQNYITGADIPENISFFNNDAGYITGDNVVTIDTDQTISGTKTFGDGKLKIKDSSRPKLETSIGCNYIDINNNDPGKETTTSYRDWGIARSSENPNNRYSVNINYPTKNGTFALTSDLPTIGAVNSPGLVAAGNLLKINADTGKMECGELTKAQYDSALGYTFISKTTLENVLTEALNYKANDTWQTKSILSVVGHITDGTSQIIFTIPVDKSLKDISNITVNKLRLIFRGNGGYVNGSSYVDYTSTSGYTITTYKTSDHLVTISIKKTSGTYSNGTNNTPIDVAVSATAGDIKLTFS